MKQHLSGDPNDKEGPGHLKEKEQKVQSPGTGRGGMAFGGQLGRSREEEQKSALKGLGGSPRVGRLGSTGWICIPAGPLLTV